MNLTPGPFPEGKGLGVRLRLPLVIHDLSQDIHPNRALHDTAQPFTGKTPAALAAGDKYQTGQRSAGRLLHDPTGRLANRLGDQNDPVLLGSHQTRQNFADLGGSRMGKRSNPSAPKAWIS